MNILPTGAATALPASSAGCPDMKDAGVQFEAVFYRTLLQNIEWASGMTGGRKAEHAVLGTMISDFFAQEAARQQNGFGSMLLKTMEGST